jgi:hypothetical protein
MENLVKQMANSQDYYKSWNETATDVQSEMFWKHIWDYAAEHHANSEFVQGCYDYFQINGFLTHKQFFYLTRQLYPNVIKLNTLRDRL